MSNPNPRYLKPQEGLTASQRRTMKLGPYAGPRQRNQGEAGSVTYCNGSITEPYRTGQGDHFAQPLRAGASQAMAIKSIGYRT